MRYDGFVNGETASVLSGTLGFNGPATAATKAGGPYTVTPEGLTSTNYAITFANGTLDIAPASLTVTADANSATSLVERFAKTYNAQVYSGFTVRYAGFVNNETPGVLNGTLTFTGPATTATGAGGPYTVTPLGLTSTDYALTYVSAGRSKSFRPPWRSLPTTPTWFSTARCRHWALCKRFVLLARTVRVSAEH